MVTEMLVLILLPKVNVNAQNQSGDAFLTEQERTWIKDNPIIKVANNTLNAPFDFAIAGQPAGLSVDYFNLLASKIGLQIEYVNYENFQSVYAGALNKEVDLIHSLSKNSIREEHFIFSTPYLDVTVKSFGKIGTGRIDSIDDLEGKRVGILRVNFLTDLYKKNYPDLNFIQFQDYREAVLALSNNEIDVFTGDSATIEYYISLYNLQNLTVIGDDHVTNDIPYFKHFAVLKNNQILLDIIDKAMTAVTNDEFKFITGKWLNDDFFYPQRNIGLSNEEKNWLANNRTIITAASLDAKPYAFLNSAGNFDGLSGDYLNEISNRLNIDFVWAANESWNEGLEQLQSGEADIIIGAARNAEREEYLIFSELFMSYETAIYSLVDGIQFPNLESLRGYTVVQVAGTANIDYLNRFYPDINILEVETLEDAVLTLSNGDVDAFTGDNMITGPLMKQAGISNIIITGIAPFNFSNGIGTRKDLPLLASSIQKALSDIPPSRRQEILQKWTLLRFIPNTDYSYLFNVVGIAAFILIVILIWNGKLTIARREADEAKKEAEEANSAKTMFLANVSHELRTPLNSILLLSKLMSENNEKNLNDRQIKQVDTINESGSELLLLIDEILDLSKIEAEQFHLNECEIKLNDVADYILNVFGPQADEAGLDFNLTIDNKLPDTFISDQHRLYQIIKNLVSNAIKFTEKGSVSILIKPHISVHNNNTLLILSVTDTGIGIDEEAQKLIFDAFSQADRSTSRKYGGTGLGLSISAELATLLGGDITVDSKLGDGATFNLILPLAANLELDEFNEAYDMIVPSTTSSNSDLNDNAKALKDKTILLVDDDTKSAFSLSELLDNFGIRSVIAESGIKALNELKKRVDIDLILMDMMMPGMDGNDAIERIRFMAKYEHVPIISLTANTMPQDQQKSMDAGANDYLTKPIDIDTLLSKMRMWIKC
mgnify:CR=1 FL=1